MRTADALCLGLIAGVMLLDHFVLWPAFLRRSSATPGRARRWLWSRWTVMLWTLGGAIIALWVVGGRSWAELRLVAPPGWRLWVSIGLVLVFAIINALPIVRVARVEGPVRVKVGNASMEKLLPRGGTEIGLWTLLSLSAGFFEELVFRGYLIWAFEPFLGLWGAAALSAVAFALGHAYQGARGIVSTGIGAVAFTLIVLALGSLWPAVLVHALLDLSQGWLAWLAFRGAEPGPAAA